MYNKGKYLFEIGDKRSSSYIVHSEHRTV